jgi:hypothetical protein
MSFRLNREAAVKALQAKANAIALQKLSEAAANIHCEEHGCSPSVRLEQDRLRIEGCCGTPEQLIHRLQHQ